LNVDPRRPGQALRGSVRLPHGTGKTVSCLVFTSDADAAEGAKKAGHAAGGEDLVDQIIAGDVTLESFDRAMATKEMMPKVQKQLSRLLGPRGLMPNPKTNSVFDAAPALLDALDEASSTITYRTEATGILHFAIGKGSFERDQLLENMQKVCQEVQDVKPEQYGKGKMKKKMGKNVKYWERAHLTSTQGKGVRMDLRTVDPTSPFFMREPE
jgi:large subunit ribosomal protein L1